FLLFFLSGPTSGGPLGHTPSRSQSRRSADRLAQGRGYSEAMASFMFLGFLTIQKPAYESRLEEGESIRLKEVWKDLEHKCFERYLDEADDDFKGVHPYQLLKKEIFQCKGTMTNDTRRDVEPAH
ncbi:unnamed protein product, partial [Polarella glacialis]